MTDEKLTKTPQQKKSDNNNNFCDLYIKIPVKFYVPGSSENNVDPKRYTNSGVYLITWPTGSVNEARFRNMINVKHITSFIQDKAEKIDGHYNEKKLIEKIHKQKYTHRILIVQAGIKLDFSLDDTNFEEKKISLLKSLKPSNIIKIKSFPCYNQNSYLIAVNLNNFFLKNNKALKELDSVFPASWLFRNKKVYFSRFAEDSTLKALCIHTLFKSDIKLSEESKKLINTFINRNDDLKIKFLPLRIN